MIRKFSHTEERQILLNVSQGDEAAFKELFDRYKDFVYSVTCRILKTTDYCEDVLQEVFLKIWKNRIKLADIQNFKGYLTTIASHHVYNIMRKRAYESLYNQHVIQEGLHAGYSLNDFHSRENAARFYADLEKSISTLTQQQQRVFRLSRIEGLKHSEIANLLKISKETVKKHVMASVDIIKKHMIYYINAEKVLLLLFLLMK